MIEFRVPFGTFLAEIRLARRRFDGLAIEQGGDHLVFDDDEPAIAAGFGRRGAAGIQGDGLFFWSSHRTDFRRISCS